MKRTITLGILQWLALTIAGTALLILLGNLIPLYETNGLRVYQLLSSTLILFLPTILVFWLRTKAPWSALQFQKTVPQWILALIPLLMICTTPGTNLLLAWNQSLTLPQALFPIEQWMRQLEDNASALTQQLLTTDEYITFGVNLIVIAIVPAIAEECFFRGALLQLFLGKFSGTNHTYVNKHLAIWLTAFIFSFIHFQFYGFVPRLMLGALFGYLFVWSESIWVPILAHATNNAIMVCTYFWLDKTHGDIHKLDTLGSGDTLYLGILSLILCGGLIYYIYRTTKRIRQIA